MSLFLDKLLGDTTKPVFCEFGKFLESGIKKINEENVELFDKSHFS